jgi:hypothetical protein
MPPDHRFGLDNFQCIQTVRHQPIECCKHELIEAAESHAFRRSALQDIELMSKNKDLGLQAASDPNNPAIATKSGYRGSPCHLLSPDSQVIVSSMGLRQGQAGRALCYAWLSECLGQPFIVDNRPSASALNLSTSLNTIG